jgi:hypothetical protein
LSNTLTNREAIAREKANQNPNGISEDMLSHVLAGRKDLSLEALTTALERIGYRLRIVPAPVVPQPQ